MIKQEVVSNVVCNRDFTEDVKFTVIEFTGDVVESSYKEFNKKVIEAVKNKQPFLPIYINSYGGSVDTALLIVDILKSSPIPIYTVNFGKSCSAGSLILSCGVKRYSLPNSRVMVHDSYSHMEGKSNELVANIEETKRLTKAMFEIMDKNLNKPIGYFQNKVKENGNIELWYDNEKALEEGLITHIGFPTVKLNVNIKAEFY